MPLIKSLYCCFAMFMISLIILALAGYLQLPSSYSSGLTGSSDTTWHTSLTENSLTEVLTAFRKWDAQVGCKQFREKYGELPTNNSSLQYPDGITCNSSKLNHVSILVKGRTWIPDSLNNLYSCRCGLSCLWTKSEVLVDKPEAVLFETTTPPFTCKGPRLKKPLDEFARRVYQELNYVQEAKNAIRVKKLYGDRPDVLVLEIFWDYTSMKVLTMDWIDDVKLNEQEAIQSQGLKLIDMVNIGIHCSLRQLLEHGYFHADPHPGNLLATADGKLAFLDFGMMSETPQQARFAIIGHVVHMISRDYEAMARDYYALDFLSPDIDVSPIVPALKGFFDKCAKCNCQRAEL